VTTAAVGFVLAAALLWLHRWRRKAGVRSLARVADREALAAAEVVAFRDPQTGRPEHGGF
jgi:hypothetical protein